MTPPDLSTTAAHPAEQAWLLRERLQRSGYLADADMVLDRDEATQVSARFSSPFLVVATRGRCDVQGLKAALALQPHGLWFVASARKADVLRQSLVASGEDTAGELIGAHTPEEIALSMLTSMVAASAKSSCCGG